jgi:hypothetical protein
MGVVRTGGIYPRLSLNARLAGARAGRRAKSISGFQHADDGGAYVLKKGAKISDSCKCSSWTHANPCPNDTGTCYPESRPRHELML